MSTDEEIIAERVKIYRDPSPMYKAFVQTAKVLITYAEEVNLSEDALGLLIMAQLKIIRIAVSPNHKDNYQDARNFITLCQKVSNRRINRGRRRTFSKNASDGLDYRYTQRRSYEV